jgi:hypothetical protein
MAIEGKKLSVSVLEVVSQDFEWFDSIYEKLVARHGFTSEIGLHEALTSALFDLASDSRIVAFLMHAEPPYFTPTTLNPGTIENCWFCVRFPQSVTCSAAGEISPSVEENRGAA